MRIVAALLLTGCLLSSAVGAEDPLPLSIEAGRRLLTERGLTTVGHRWLTAAEVRLNAQLDSLEKLQRQLRQAEKAVEDRIAENRQQQQQLVELGQSIVAHRQRRDAALDIALKKKLTDELTRLATQETALRAKVRTPEQFAEDPGVRRAVIDWINARNALTVVVVGYVLAVERVQTANAALRADEEVERGLRGISNREELGSGRNYAVARRHVDEVARQVLTPWTPLYRQNSRWRTTLIVNEVRPCACTIQDGSGPLLLPDSVARAAGVVVPNEAPTQFHDSGDGRQLAARSVRIAQIRLGGQMIHDVEALVLPPEGEDLGTTLNSAALPGVRVKLDPQRLRVLLERRTIGPPETGTTGQPASAPAPAKQR